MKHVPAPRAAGGVKVLGDIRRVVRVNLVALRDLRALTAGEFDKDKTPQLQRYVLGLALVAATHPLQLNLREGCLLCEIDDTKKKASWQLVSASGKEVPFDVDQTGAAAYAEQAARTFFGDKYEQKDFPDEKFEAGVANKFLAMPAGDRKKLSRNGPISDEAIRKFEENGRDPLKLVLETIKEAKKALPKASGKNAIPLVSPDSFKLVSEKLGELTDDEQITQAVKDLVGKLQKLITDDKDTNSSLKALEKEIKEFTKQQKAGAGASNSAEPNGAEPA